MQNKLKGTTRIELTDVRTGAREVYENHNMVTNALRDLFQPLGLCDSPTKMFTEFSPYYQKLLGGILCFDTAIDENPDNYYPPAGARLVGCAAYGTQNNTTNTFRGGFNQTESEVNFNDRYVKYVYDFATSQANGTIACVCLSHLNAGFTSYGGLSSTFNGNYPLGISFCDNQLQYVHPNETGASTSSKYSGLTVGTTELIFLIDRKEDCVFYFKIIDTTHISITKRRAHLKNVSILESPRTTKKLIDEIQLDEITTELNTGRVAYNYDPEDSALYIFTSSANTTAHNGTYLITKITVDTWTVEQWTMTNTSGITLNTSGHWWAFATDGYVYIKGYSAPYDIYKFEIGNAANVIMLKRCDGVSNIDGVPVLVVNGRIYYEHSSSQLYIANTKTNEVLKPENQGVIQNSHQCCYTPIKDEPLMFFGDLGTYSSGGYYFMANYLATINNLDTPVTKTADKTMKITYILQEQ